MRHRVPTLVGTLLIFGAAATPFAAERPGEQVLAIQERVFDRHHEVGLAVGYLTDVDFERVFPVGLNYVFNFNENLAWEVLRAQYAFNRDKDLKKNLEDDFGVTPTEFKKTKYLIHTNFLLKPSYGKDALWNRSIVNHETYVLFGTGIVGYERDTSDGTATSEHAFSLSLGVGRKYFLSKSLCLNLEVRDLVNFTKDGTENNVYLGVGLGYRFELAPRKVVRDDGADRLKDVLQRGHGDE